MSEPNADLLKAAKEYAIELWKKAKSLFHKMAKEHGHLAKCHEKAAGHHENLADHHAALCEDAADKTVTAELQKLADTADFKKLAKADQIIARIEACEKGDLSKAHKGFAKMGKEHANLAKCHTKAAGHHDNLDKAAVDVGSAEDKIDMQSREEDDAAAHPGGSSEKEQKIADLEKQIKELKGEKEDPALAKVLDALKAMDKKIDEQGTTLTAVKKDVDEKLNTLEPGPDAAKKAEAKLALDDKHAVDDKGNDKSGGKQNPLAVKKTTDSTAAGTWS